MNPLEEKIIERIRKAGPVTFEAFMDMALYYPELGYYSSNKTAIGRAGDFYTSPHLHPIFGAMIAKQFMEMWTVMERPPVFHVVEIGAGAGYLCKDILDYLQRSSSDDKNDFLKALRYVIVEPYAHFEEKQRELLAPPLGKGGQRVGNISWVRSLEEYKGQITGCIFSNELLDAFPVHLVEMEDEKVGLESPTLEKGDAGGFSKQLKEIYIDFNGGEFVEIKDKVSSAKLTDYLKAFSANIPSGYRTEINLRTRDWLEEINAALSRGFILTIDYGYSAQEYYSEERTKGTLLCYHKHQVNENPYQNIGAQDITAHVNFSSLKKWGEEIGLKTTGYCQQGIFLIASGIDEVITELYADRPDYEFEMAKIKGLIFPQGMGETHNVMVQYKGEDSPDLRGFSIRDQKGNL
ncbi:MAG: SAM-dependent methyltransferase [Nitrospirae bacterium]|nr:SAM-dependent methyltransferase [Nitrospirota bacterium]